MRELEYQTRVLGTFNAYSNVLKDRKTKADKVPALVAADPDFDVTPQDFAKNARENMKAAGKLPHTRAAIPIFERFDGCERPVTNVTA